MYVWDDILPSEASSDEQLPNGGQDGNTALQEATEMASSTAKRGIQAQVQSEVATDSDTPPRRTRQLSDIYNNCSFALYVVDPVTYEDVTKSSE